MSSTKKKESNIHLLLQKLDETYRGLMDLNIIICDILFFVSAWLGYGAIIQTTIKVLP